MLMRIVLNLFLLLATTVAGFVPLVSRTDSTTTTLFMGYVPDGMSQEQYRKLMEKEKKDAAAKKFAAYGPQSFKSRSLQSFQKDMEKGKAGHLMPVFNAKEKVKKGLIKPEDVPYMQRGGAWDNSDVKTAKKREWTESDKRYEAGQAAPANVDWTGKNMPKGGPKNVKQQPKGKQEPPPMKLFGLF